MFVVLLNMVLVVLVLDGLFFYDWLYDDVNVIKNELVIMLVMFRNFRMLYYVFCEEIKGNVVENL